MDAVVIHFSYIDIAGGVGGDARRAIKLTISRTITAPLGQEGTGAIKLLDTVVALIGHIDIASGVGGDASGRILNTPSPLPLVQTCSGTSVGSGVALLAVLVVNGIRVVMVNSRIVLGGL